jgi:tRNA nucleotidyltransferase (CCA-adding enzyme)
MAALLHDIGKAPTKRFNKKQDGLFMDMNFWAVKWKKIFERLHAVEPK